MASARLTTVPHGDTGRVASSPSTILFPLRQETLTVRSSLGGSRRGCGTWRSRLISVRIPEMSMWLLDARHGV